MVYLWRAVDDEGTVLGVAIQRRRNAKAALRLLRKLLKSQGVKPTRIVTDRLDSYGAALKLLGLKHLQDMGGKRTIERNALMFRYEDENERLRSSGLRGTLKNYAPHMVKSTISSTTATISSQDQHSESSDIKPIQNGI